ncbi:MAG TPA: PilZ domain-containing protein [Allosphingosinicella sp.]|nr:PilZ domain-containing protein [Allosphingosinicella sp.]
MTSKSDPAAPEQVPGFKARRVARVAIQGDASLCPKDRYHVEVTVRDLSASGFMAECVEPVRIGSYVSLDIPGIGPVHAQVRWQIGIRMGGMFLDPISLARCEWTAEKAEAA